VFGTPHDQALPGHAVLETTRKLQVKIRALGALDSPNRTSN
jgi:hypothetical protein